MQYNEEEQGRMLQPDAGNRQLVILNQFLQVVGQMEHIDDVFMWLASMMVQRLGADGIQIWTTQFIPTGQVVPGLRATLLRDPSIPQHVVNNTQSVEVANRVLIERRPMQIQGVERIFSLHQANLLKRYGLYYCGGCFLVSNKAIPSLRGQAFSENANIPSLLVVLVFLKQLSSQHSLANFSRILEQALPIADRQGLLLAPRPTAPVSMPDRSLQPSFMPPISELVPRRLRSNTSMRSSSPFSSSGSISDKRALAFFGAIDGVKTVADIGVSKRLNVSEVAAALRILLKEERIQLYTRAGQQVDSQTILKTI